MTLNEARDILVAEMGADFRYIMVGADATWHGNYGVTEFSVAVQPGMDGTACQIFYGRSLDVVMAECRLAYRNHKEAKDQPGAATEDPSPASVAAQVDGMSKGE